MTKQKNIGWKFVGDNGEFILESPDRTSYLYFPLANEAGIMSSITPLLRGDVKTGQNTFALEPVSVMDLHNKKSARNFWFLIDDEEVWSATGNSAKQETLRFEEDSPERVTMEAGMLWHRIVRRNESLGLESEVTNFVPTNDDKVELMKVKITNMGDEPKKITPTAAIPLYGRSADNLRDHRHVTSLLHRIKLIHSGVVVTPTLSFDERGHEENDISYMVIGRDGEGKNPLGFFPVFEDFVGEGGSLEWPKVVVENSDDYSEAGEEFEGYEAVGALRFEDEVLEPGEEKSYVLAIAIGEGDGEENIAAKYCSEDDFESHLTKNRNFWRKKTDRVQLNSGDEEFDLWMKWVTLQPLLRRIYGCSFLPHHDYGRGGRGWRDLWQDCLSLLLMEPERVRDLLLNNFAGVRMDGSNATIIGSEPGEFVADRNDISRTWMDHGAWPFLTTELYIDRSGDLEFLLEEQAYFKDAQIHRSRRMDESWRPENGKKLLNSRREPYRGTVLEHLLVQHLTQFFNVGEHNNIRQEGAGWNDALDMAEEKGENVAFTAFYGGNMLKMADLLRELKDRSGTEALEIAEEMVPLLDTLRGEIDYDSVEEKNELLDEYFASCETDISGEKVKVDIDEVIEDLERKGNWIFEHIRGNEWIRNREGLEWFNGYYDNSGNRLEGDHLSGVRMTLTGQVFNIMEGVATEEQIEKITEAADHFLKDETVGGYRLNTDFREVKTDMGRGFGFAYGHKENGAMFSHMAVMYSNGLYRRGFVERGHEVIDSIYKHCKDFERSKIYPGIPEYINRRGRGMYHYLTGSASWLLLTMITRVYGVRGKLGDLVLDPKLLREQFNGEGKASITTEFAGTRLKITYHNKSGLDWGEYGVKKIEMNDESVDFEISDGSALIKRGAIAGLNGDEDHPLEVYLDRVDDR